LGVCKGLEMIYIEVWGLHRGKEMMMLWSPNSIIIPNVQATDDETGEIVEGCVVNPSDVFITQSVSELLHNFAMAVRKEQMKHRPPIMLPDDIRARGQ
jgi:hypothetical protein